MDDDDANDHPANPSGVVVEVARSSLFDNDFSSSMVTFVARVLLVLLSAATAVADVIITYNKNLGISIFMVLYVTIIILWKRTQYYDKQLLLRMFDQRMIFYAIIVPSRLATGVLSSLGLLFSSISNTFGTTFEIANRRTITNNFL